MRRQILHSTLREMQRILSTPRLWIVFAVVIALFAMTGPFGTYASLAGPARLGYWLIVHALTWSVAIACVTLANETFRGKIAHTLPRMLIGGAFAALPVGAVLMPLNAWMLGTPFSLAEYGEDIITALPVSLAMCVLVWLALSGEESDAAAVPQASTAAAATDRADLVSPARSAIMNRLTSNKRGALIRLEVQDHYVLVVTAKGREMLLMRLADAMRETEPVNGMQIHRSHWVARDGVADIVREPGRNGRTILRTTDGANLPVSRGNLAEVKTWVNQTP